ncbi:thymidylate synthase [Chryseobacterium sp. BIGb0186]|nr:thymidylate synthase [Chryseobacterium sp. BIGb0186]
MNSYLKEIASLCLIDDDLTTHKARRTFANTVTLKNGVPIHIVKEMMGHQSVKQTEEYAITEQESIGKEMSQLKEMLKKTTQDKTNSNNLEYLESLEKQIQKIYKKKVRVAKKNSDEKIDKISKELMLLRKLLRDAKV